MENTVPETLCQERMKLQDERFARDKHRLDKVEERLDDVEQEQSDVGKALLKLTTLEEQDHVRLDDHEKRIGAVENRPNEWMNKVWSAAISAGVALIFNLFK